MLDKTSFANALKQLFIQMKNNPDDDALAEGLATLIDNYIKSATVTGVATVSSSGQLYGPTTFPVNGSIQ